MFSYKVYLNTDNKIRTLRKEKKAINEIELGNNVYALYLDIISNHSICVCNDMGIDSEKGVETEITFDESPISIMADTRISEFWCAPHFTKKLSDIPDDTQLLLFKLKDGRYGCLIPVVNDKYKSVIKGSGKDKITLRTFSWCDGLYEASGMTLVYSIGKNPAKLIENCVTEALKKLNSGTRHISERRYPEIFEYLGWCSWDSMQIRVCESGLIEKCEEFKSKNIPVKWAIIDDMWAEIRDFYGKEYESFMDMIEVMHRSSLWSFNADPKRFPRGLSHTISKIKEYGLKVGMWHPTTGYWRGINPDGEAYKELKDYLIKAKNNMLVPDYKTSSSYMYYKTLHDSLTQCGADFVKIDNQSMTNRYYKGLAPVGQVAKEFHDGMEASVGEHFDNAMINCMGMASEDMWNRRVSPISRTSDDFQPENKAWFTKHILQCAYNSLLQGQFYFCDWDMWWTDDGQAKKNSLMRAISGGPIYVSDKIGRSNKDILSPLCLEDGKILRCDKPCIPTKDCMTEDARCSGYALKLQNTVKDHGILALLNIDENEAPVKAEISIDDIDDLTENEYAVYEHFSEELIILKRGESFKTELKDSDDYRLYIFCPIKDGFAVIGRTDKFISPKTVEYVHGKEIKLVEDGPYAYVLDGKLIKK